MNRRVPTVVVLSGLLLAGVACKARPKPAAPPPSPVAAPVTTADATVLVRGKGVTAARLERHGDAWLLSVDGGEVITCRRHDEAKRRCRSPGGTEVAEVKVRADAGGEGAIKLHAPDGKLLWKVRLGPEKIKISDNEENREPWTLSLKHGDKIKVEDPKEQVVGVFRRGGGGEARAEGADGAHLFTVEGGGASAAGALLLVSALPARDRLILMAELLARGL